MTSSAKSDWLVPASLIALSVVPVLAGVVRLAKLAGDGAVVAADQRFVVQPAPVVIHILAVSAFCVLGAFQFAPGFRRRHLRWHRAMGRLVAPCGLIAALTGLWMTQFYPNADNAGDVLYGLRLLVGSAMAVSILMALAALRRRDFPRHGAWMIRGYALGQGAGTQALTGLPWALLLGRPGMTANAVLMGGSWLINIALAEWIIRRRRAGPIAPADKVPLVA